MLNYKNQRIRKGQRIYQKSNISTAIQIAQSKERKRNGFSINRYVLNSSTLKEKEIHYRMSLIKQSF